VTENENAAANQMDLSPRERIVRAARQLFFSHGFGAVTTDMLAREASTSKATIYKYFDSKTDILSAVVDLEGGRFRVDAGQMPTDRKGYKTALRSFGLGLIDLLADPDVLSFEQLMISEARTHPEGAATFHSRALMRTLNELERIISFGQERGFIEDRYSSIDLADMLISSWRGMTHACLQLGLANKPYPDREERVDRCISIIAGLD
jgi:TetR/AcrR family transcriptional repressor of mexJK operon